MGWTKHIDWALESDFDMLRFHDQFEELDEDQIEQLGEIVQNVMWGRPVTAAERKRFDEEFTPLRSRIDDLHTLEALQHALDKDD